MINDLNRPPTKAERVIAIIVSAVAAAAFGSVAALVLLSSPVSVPAAAIFSVLFIGSATMFFRAAFTAPRSLSVKETRRLSWLLLIGGVLVAPLALWAGASAQGLMLLGASLSSVAYGLAGLSWRGTDA
ncbi:hypothetical protein [Luteimonas vadosa]